MACVVFSNVAMISWSSVAYAGKKFGGFKVLAGSYGVRGTEPPRTPEKFRKFAKNFLRKLQKMHYFCIFFEKN